MTANSQTADYTHPMYTEMVPDWDLVSHCIQGERAIKNQGTIYLPHPASDGNARDDRYRAYQDRAVFLPATERTLQAMLGVAFSKPPVIDITGKLEILKDDVDNKGQALTQMVRDALGENLAKGRAGVFVDYLGAGAQTAQTESRAVLRLFYAKDIINWRNQDDQLTLIVLKYEEDAKDTDPDSFAENRVTVWLELRMVDGKACWRKWYNSEQPVIVNGVQKQLSRTELTPFLDASRKTFDQLPFFFIGAVNNDECPDRAPLRGIASVNVKHYQSEADLSELAHIVGQPTLVISGLTQPWVDKNLSGGVKLGASKGVSLPAEARAELLQAEERNVCMAMCERREKQMAMLGAALIERGSAPKTATEAEFDAQTDNSILSLCASNVESAFNAALKLASRFMPGEGSISLNKRFVDITVDSNMLNTMITGMQSGAIPLSDFIRWAQNAGVIDDKLSPDEVEDAMRNAPPLPGAMIPTPVVVNKDPDAEDLNDGE